MFRVILWSQWRWSRGMVILGALLAALVPMLSVRVGSPAEGEASTVIELLRQVRSWGAVYPLLALGLGLLVAISAWAPDHRGKHIHALSLPIARWRYALLRYGAGVTLLVVPMLALLLGALLVRVTTTLPAGLQAYPLALTIRFSLAALVTFSVFFAIAGGTPRTALIVLLIITVVVAFAMLVPATAFGTDAVTGVLQGLFSDTGLFGIFTGRWMLVDV